MQIWKVVRNDFTEGMETIYLVFIMVRSTERWGGDSRIFYVPGTVTDAFHI